MIRYLKFVGDGVMMGRASTSGKASKRQRRGIKGRRRHPREPISNLEKEPRKPSRELAELQKQLADSLARQKATAHLLEVISRSTFDLQIVLDAVVASAAELCEADVAAITHPKGDHFEHVASYGYSDEYRTYMKSVRAGVGRASISGRTTLEARPVHILDLEADPHYALEKFGSRTSLGVPLLRDGTVIGVLVLQRKTVRAFTNSQVELVKTFAAQAVIAIENARLLNELRQRTDNLTDLWNNRRQQRRY